MIQGLQRIFRKIVSKQNTLFVSQKPLITLKSLNFNYIPAFNFGDRKKYIITNFNYGFIYSIQNGSFNEVNKEWQTLIFDQIKTFYEVDPEEQANILLNIHKYWYKESDQIILIDKTILEFIEEVLESADLTELQKQENYHFLKLFMQKFVIHIKFLQYFDSMKDSEKIELYSQYLDLHQQTLKILPDNSREEKAQSYCFAQAISIYATMQWIKNIDDSNRDYIIKILTNSLAFMQKILEEIQNAEQQNKIKIDLLQYFTSKIHFLFEKFEFCNFQNTNGISFLFEFFSKNEQIFENFKSIIALNDYYILKIRNCLNFIKLGYIEEALKSILRMHEMRLQKGFLIDYYSLLYYCLKKTQNTSYNLEELISEIKNKDFNEYGQPPYYNYLILMQQLHKFISEQKYSQLKPIIDQLINPIPIDSDLSKLVMFPLFVETIINNPKIPNRLNYSKHLVEQLCSSNFTNNPSYYQDLQRELYRQALSLIISVQNDDNTSKIIADNIKKLFKSSQSDNFQKDGINLIVKLIPQIESPKTYKILTDIIDPLIFSLQKDKYQQENQKLLEILNSHKIKLRQKYYKKQK